MTLYLYQPILCIYPSEKHPSIPDLRVGFKPGLLQGIILHRPGKRRHGREASAL